VQMAEAKGIPAEIATNGSMIDLTGDEPEIVEFIEAGRIYLDGAVKIGAMDGVVRDRIRMALNGHVLVTLIIDEEDEPLGEPWAEAKGLPVTGTSGAPLVELIEADLEQFLGRAKDKLLTDDTKLDEAIRRAVRQTCVMEIGRKPEVTVVISRLA
jgi:ribonuclease J